ncbi:MAG: hypothetical protein C0417_01940 [Chlorobiaceae bacterium]|nr:hypothetical protein [Chlorobiaceae bacterium]
MLEKITNSFNSNIWVKRSVFAVIGGVLGFGYYFFVGCYNGTCPISSSPYISTLYGAGIGMIIPSKKKEIPE